MNGLFSTTSDFLLLVAGFSFIIFVHELGHFLAARWAGIRVDQFAIGFGQPIVAWRRGWGFSFGKATPAPGVGQSGRDRQTDVGETEYRINWIPLGGYVRMLGQDDLDMYATAADPRSYSSKSVGARMVVVSAGVVMNVILAAVLFVICYSWGVPESPAVVGYVSPASDTAHVFPAESGVLGIRNPGLQPGDEVIAFNDRPISKFSQLILATALSRPGETARLRVKRGSDVLNFKVAVDTDRDSRLLDLGVSATVSTRLMSVAADEPNPHRQEFDRLLSRAGLDPSVIAPGMTLTAVDGQPVSEAWQLQQAVNTSHGRPLELTFSYSISTDADDLPDRPDTAPRVVEIAPRPSFQTGRVRTAIMPIQVEHMLGLCPAVAIESVLPGTPAEEAGLKAGDVIFRIDGLTWPRADEFMAVVHNHRGDEIELTYIRESIRQTEIIKADRDGRLGIYLDRWAEPILAGSFAFDGESRALGMRAVSTATSTEEQSRSASALNPWSGAALGLLPGTRILACNGIVVESWEHFQRLVRGAIESLNKDAETALAISPSNDRVPLPSHRLMLEVEWPTPGRPTQKVIWDIPIDQGKILINTGWNVDPLPSLFRPLERIHRAESIAEALGLGVRETWEMIQTTYLTLDRLLRGSIRAEHLKGPVGIAEIGTKVADQGLPSLLMFLAVISVNLAVLNFLPIPIVDGGLFVFLIIEKIKGSPVSARVQEIATLVGLFLIGTLFLVTFYNDIMSLFTR